MNLLDASWLPLRRRSGRSDQVAPWQITAAVEDPLVAFASPRPDFDGTLAQFLVGLLQTTLAPRTESEWRKRLVTPPTSEELRAAFAPYEAAFELLGEGPRFFQDLTLTTDDSEPWPIEKLLLSNGMSEGKDHFVRTGSIGSMCLPCAATALMCLQLSAPSGGVGHRVSLRGGGPLTTLVWTEESLWQALWLNVLPDADFRSGSTSDGSTDRSLVFPWLAPSRTSEGGRVTTFADVDPLQMYWSMPRRIRLAAAEEHGRCDICGATDLPAVRSYATKNYGPSYSGPWPHPLTPYRGKPGEKLPAKGDRHGLAYRDWLGLIQNDADRQQEPARVVSAYFAEERGRKTGESLRLWAFGYAVDNAKPMLWCEGTMPLYPVPAERRSFIEGEVACLVLGAREAQSLLRWAVKQTLSARPRDVKSTPPDLSSRFWQETEDLFFERLRNMHDAPAEEEKALPIRQQWHRDLCRAAEWIFDAFAEQLWFGSTDPGRVARAGNSLRAMLRGKRMLDSLRLPPPTGLAQRAAKVRSRKSKEQQESPSHE